MASRIATGAAQQRFSALCRQSLTYKSFYTTTSRQFASQPTLSFSRLASFRSSIPVRAQNKPPQPPSAVPPPPPAPKSNDFVPPRKFAANTVHFVPPEGKPHSEAAVKGKAAPQRIDTDVFLDALGWSRAQVEASPWRRKWADLVLTFASSSQPIHFVLLGFIATALTSVVVAIGGPSKIAETVLNREL